MQRTDFVARVRACERRLYRIARTMLACDADCEDAVQEALLRAWSKLPSLREEQYFETWLIRILINECRRFYRRNPVPAEPLPESLTAPEESSAVMDALMSLPEKHRIALELHCIEGYSVREVARMLRLPEGKRKSLLRESLTAIIMECADKTLSFDGYCGYLCAELHQRAVSQGRTPTIEDLMIAAICLRNDAVLATRNAKDFEDLGLTLVNPFEYESETLKRLKKEQAI